MTACSASRPDRGVQLDQRHLRSTDRTRQLGWEVAARQGGRPPSALELGRERPAADEVTRPDRWGAHRRERVRGRAPDSCRELEDETRDGVADRLLDEAEAGTAEESRRRVVVEPDACHECPDLEGSVATRRREPRREQRAAQAAVPGIGCDRDADLDRPVRVAIESNLADRCGALKPDEQPRRWRGEPLGKPPLVGRRLDPIRLERLGSGRRVVRPGQEQVRVPHGRRLEP